jgi:cytochrome P450
MQARASLCKILSKIIDERKRQMEEGTVDVNENIIYSFLSLRDENDEPLIEEEILDMVLSLIMASHDSTTILLCLLVRLLSRDAEIYNKVLEGNKIYLTYA